jgi:dipeptidyl aminopeptidase/acylaminoacyl peptidase
VRKILLPIVLFALLTAATTAKQPADSRPEFDRQDQRPHTLRVWLGNGGAVESFSPTESARQAEVKEMGLYTPHVARADTAGQREEASETLEKAVEKPASKPPYWTFWAPLGVTLALGGLTYAVYAVRSGS